MVPILNISLMVARRHESNCSSLILRIYGATYPAVPQRTKRYLVSSARVARLKSMILISFLGVIRMFSGFRSRWRTPFLDMYRTALRICRRMMAVSSLFSEDLDYFFFCDMYCYREVPSTFSSTKYRILSSSKTPWSLAMFSWSSSLRSLI